MFYFFILFFGGGFKKINFSSLFLFGQPTIFLTGFFSKHPYLFLLIFIWSTKCIFLTGFFQTQAFFFFFFNPPGSPNWAATLSQEKLKLCLHYRARHYFIEARCSTLKGSSIYIHLISNFIIFFYLTCTYRHSKLKKGM